MKSSVTFAAQTSYNSLYEDSWLTLRASETITKERLTTKAKMIVFLIYSGIIPEIEHSLKGKEIIKLLETKRVVITFENISELNLKNQKIVKDALFIPSNLHPFPLRNGADEMYISIDPIISQNKNMDIIVSHEFFHLIHYLSNREEDSWIREGLAQYFSYKVTNRYPPGFTDALHRSSTSLVDPFYLDESTPEQYSHTFLYFYYLFSKCENDNLMFDITLNTKRSAEGIDDLLNSAKGNCPRSFRESVLNFEVARIHNQYSGKEQLALYKLMESSSYYRIEALVSIPSERELLAIKRYMPLLFDGKYLTQALLNRLNEIGFVVAQLEKSYPFTVTFINEKNTHIKDISRYNFFIMRE